ncbi:MAG: MalY/PatB family protein [[Clostridium] innocuum]
MNPLFDTVIERRNTNSLKWNVEEDTIAMWVADMDFRTAPCIQKAMQNTAALGIYGYCEVPEAFYTSIQEWWRQEHCFAMEREWMMFSSGVVPAISSMVRRLTQPAEKVVVLSPVYNIFYNSIVNNGRRVLASELLYEGGTYEIDFIDLEQKLQDPLTTLMVLCNPHNPIGKLWSREELTQINALCRKHHVIVISDEIHCELCEPGEKYLPFASVNASCLQNSITCLSASKAFNLAGLQAACVVIADEGIRNRIWRGFHTDEVAEPNVFACEASIAAWIEGKDWLKDLNHYISANKKTAQHDLKTQLPELHAVESQATYLLWIDCHVLHPFVDQFCDYLHKEHGLLVSKGSAYGKSGEDFIRINIACPNALMRTGLKRLSKGYCAFTKQFSECR